MSFSIQKIKCRYRITQFFTIFVTFLQRPSKSHTYSSSLNISLCSPHHLLQKPHAVLYTQTSMYIRIRVSRKFFPFNRKGGKKKLANLITQSHIYPVDKRAVILFPFFFFSTSSYCYEGFSSKIVFPPLFHFFPAAPSIL